MLYKLIQIAIAATVHAVSPGLTKSNNPVVNTKQKTPSTVMEKPVKKVSKELQDTTYHYYSNRRLSVKTSPWKDGRRNIWLYNLKGEITYTIEDVNLSFSSLSEIHFRADGSVEKIHIKSNPGASMYWYETLITFSIHNEPEWKRAEKFPQQSLDDFFDRDYYWDTKTKQWKKQQVMEAHPLPKE